MGREEELRYCTFAATALSLHLGRSVLEYEDPELKAGHSPVLDLIVQTNEGRVLIEHTKIESFSGQILDDKDFMRVVAPLEQDLRGKLPGQGHYQIDMDCRAIGRIRNHEEVRARIACWAILKAPSLALGSPDTAPHHLTREQIEGVPFEVTLSRWAGGEGEVYTGRFVPPAVEEQRVARIAVALEKKCPKLEEHRGQRDTTALVLEYDDVALANEALIRNAIIQAVKECRAPIPDFFVLIDPRFGRTEVYLLAKDDVLAPRTSARMKSYRF